MMFSSESSLIKLLLIICSAIMAQRGQAALASANKNKVVRIRDMIPTHNPIQPSKPLLVHCRSADDDLGVWTMKENALRYIRFRVNFWGTTRFSCRFDWGTKSQTVDVYNASPDRCQDERYCTWQVKTDGFYFAKGEFPLDSDFVRLANWI